VTRDRGTLYQYYTGWNHRRDVAVSTLAIGLALIHRRRPDVQKVVRCAGARAETAADLNLTAIPAL